MYRHITVKVKITFIILFQVVKNWRFKKKNPTTGLMQSVFALDKCCIDFVTNSYCMVSPGTHLVKKHDPHCITNESQFKKHRVLNWKCLGLYVTRQLV